MKASTLSRCALSAICGALLATALVAPASAHNLILEAYAVGGKSIEGDAFFSDGTLVKGATIVVSDDAGKVLREVRTDDKGGFAYTPSEAVTQHLFLDVGSGHVAKVVIAAEKLAAGSAAAATLTSGPATRVVAVPPGNSVAPGQDRIANLVRTEIEPLVTEVETYKSHNDRMNLLAAIGLLCGFAGVLLFSAGAALVKSTPAAASTAASRTTVGRSWQK
jgi:nickel transport protein